MKTVVITIKQTTTMFIIIKQHQKLLENNVNYNNNRGYIDIYYHGFSVKDLNCTGNDVLI